MSTKLRRFCCDAAHWRYVTWPSCHSVLFCGAVTNCKFIPSQRLNRFRDREKHSSISIQRTEILYIWSDVIINSWSNLKSILSNHPNVKDLFIITFSGSRHRWSTGHANVRRVFGLLQDDVSQTGPVPADDGLQWQEGPPDSGWARQLSAQWAECEQALKFTENYMNIQSIFCFFFLLWLPVVFSTYSTSKSLTTAAACVVFMFVFCRWPMWLRSMLQK